MKNKILVSDEDGCKVYKTIINKPKNKVNTSEFEISDLISMNVILFCLLVGWVCIAIALTQI